MVNKLSLQDLQNIRNALQEFTEARTQAKPDKDLILTVIKIDGRNTLQSTRLSKMKWYSRLIRWFGLGGSTLKSVAQFLRRKEPYLPRKFYGQNKDILRLQHKDHLKMNYTDEAVEYLTDIEKMTKVAYRELQRAKSKGYEIIKHCIDDHNKAHKQKIMISFCENEKINLREVDIKHRRFIGYSSPNPMSPFPIADEHLNELYSIKDIEKKKKENDLEELSPKVLGFCYEHGIGIEKNRDEAIKNYRKDFQNEYSAAYNLGHLFLKDGEISEAIESLKQAEAILLAMLNKAQNGVDEVKKQRWHRDIVQDLLKPEEMQDPNREEEAEAKEKRLAYIEMLEKENSYFIKKWNKALHQTYIVLIEAYKKAGNKGFAAEYQQKAGIP